MLRILCAAACLFRGQAGGPIQPFVFLFCVGWFFYLVELELPQISQLAMERTSNLAYAGTALTKSLDVAPPPLLRSRWTLCSEKDHSRGFHDRSVRYFGAPLRIACRAHASGGVSKGRASRHGAGCLHNHLGGRQSRGACQLACRCVVRGIGK